MVQHLGHIDQVVSDHRNNGPVYNAPIVANNGVLYFGTVNGSIYAYAPKETLTRQRGVLTPPPIRYCRDTGWAAATKPDPLVPA